MTEQKPCSSKTMEETVEATCKVLYVSMEVGDNGDWKCVNNLQVLIRFSDQSTMKSHSAVSLFLLFTWLAAAKGRASMRLRSTGDQRTFGPRKATIIGMNVVQVGVTYPFECSTQCDPACTYAWEVDGETREGNTTNIVIHELLRSKLLTCVVTNPSSGESTRAHHSVKVAEGPSGVSIRAPEMVVNGWNYTLECSFEKCFPSCNYTWLVKGKKVGFGRELVYTVPLHNTKHVVICQSRNTLSGLFAAGIATLQVAQGPNAVNIRGPTNVMVGDTLVYYCFADCTPSCNITWNYQGKTLHGTPVTVPIMRRGNMVLGEKLVVVVKDLFNSGELTCTTANALSGKSMSAIYTLNVTDSVAVVPVLPTPAIVNYTYSLRCDGALPGFHSIQWTRFWKPLSTNDRVRLMENNTTLSFHPLSQFDNGLYNCIVTQQGKVIPGIMHTLNVIYGPVNPELTLADNNPADRATILRPGSSVTFFCSASCSPSCTYVWVLNNDIVGTNSTYSISSASSADEGSLSCVVANSESKANVSVQTQIQLIGGPKNVTISGPKSVAVGQKSTFECSAVCTPPCMYIWNAYGTTLHGNKVELTVSHSVATEDLVCKAINLETKEAATASVTVDVTDAGWCGC
ncbi:hemicentin-1-like isoform X2 [Engraulis encrasicolus]|uniref:hemicentin-1-like isoform X2 n=1 Tax=Engraulis encrasicolus TaxID=184585 RepID=UPI002FD75EA3